MASPEAGAPRGTQDPPTPHFAYNQTGSQQAREGGVCGGCAPEGLHGFPRHLENTCASRWRDAEPTGTGPCWRVWPPGSARGLKGSEVWLIG